MFLFQTRSAATAAKAAAAAAPKMKEIKIYRWVCIRIRISSMLPTI
jgi:hypothetical protein